MPQENNIQRFIGTAAEYATFIGTTTSVLVGSTYWVYDVAASTSMLYKSFGVTATTFTLYITLG
jgi:hypothetical protein